MHRWLFLIGLLVSAPLSAETVQIGAAANLRYVLPAIIAHFEAQHEDVKIAVSYAASGNLSNQIRHGAPYQVFLSADAESVAPLVANKLISGAPFSYADAQLVLFAKHDAEIQLDLSLVGLKQYLQSDPQQKVAIANPQHAPYGRAAKQYMQQHDVWSLAKPHLVQAENASQLTQFTLTGNVVLGFMPLSHALQPAIQRQGRYLILPLVLQQQGILTPLATKAAEQFVAFLQADKARQHFLQQGFVMPGATP